MIPEEIRSLRAFLRVPQFLYPVSLLDGLRKLATRRSESDDEVCTIFLLFRGVIVIIVLCRVWIPADNLDIDLALTHRRVLYRDEAMATLSHLEANVQLTDDVLDHGEPPSGNRSVHHQVHDAARIEPDLERFLVYELVSRRYEVLRICASVLLKIRTFDAGVLEVAAEAVVPLGPAFELGSDHATEIIVLLDDIGQRHIHENIVCAFRTVHRPFRLLAEVIEEDIRNCKITEG